MAEATTTTPAQATPNAGAVTTNPPAGNPPLAPAATPEPVAPPTAVTGADVASAPAAGAPAGTNPPPAAEPPATKVPEKYDLKLSENSLLDAAYVEKVAAIAKQRNLSNEEAQQILSEQDAALGQAVADRSSKWVEQLRADGELGPTLSKKVELAKRVVDRFGSEALKTELNRSGFGNHPELVRILSRVGEAMSEDTLIHPGQPPKDRPSTAEVLYGKKTA